MLYLCQRLCRRTGNCMWKCWGNVLTQHGFWQLQTDFVDSCTVSRHMGPIPVFEQTGQNPQERWGSLKTQCHFKVYYLFMYIVSYHISVKRFLYIICDVGFCEFDMRNLCQRLCHRTGSHMWKCWDNVWTQHGFWQLQTDFVDSCTMSRHTGPIPVFQQTVQNPQVLRQNL